MSFLSELLLKGIENPKFVMLAKSGELEIRRYQPCIAAETIVDGSMDTAGNSAFGLLAGFIFGKNEGKKSISMTAPVSQQQIGTNTFAVQFMMPSEWSLQTLPRPLDPRVSLKVLPERTVAVHRYNGGWSLELYEKELNNLWRELQVNNLRPVQGKAPIWARYNSPMAPSFMRTNEIMVEIQ